MPEGLKPPLLFRQKPVMPKSGRPQDVVFPRGEVELTLQEMADFGPVERMAEVGDRIMSSQGEVGLIEAIEGGKEHVRLPSGEKVVLDRQQRRAFDMEQGNLLSEAIGRTRQRLWAGLAAENVAQRREEMKQQQLALQRELEQYRENARISAEYQRSMQTPRARREFKQKYLKGAPEGPSFDLSEPATSTVPPAIRSRIESIQTRAPENLPSAGAGVSRTLKQLRPDLFPKEVEPEPAPAEPFQLPEPAVPTEGWLTQNPGSHDLVNAMPDPPRPVFPAPHRINHFTPEEHTYLLIAYQDARTPNLRQALAEAAGGNPRVMFDGNAIRVGVQHDSLEDVDADHLQHAAMQKALTLPDLPEWAKEEIKRELEKPPRKPTALLEYSRAPYRIQQPMLSPEEMESALPGEASRRQIATRFGGEGPQPVVAEEEPPWFKREKLPWMPFDTRQALQHLEAKLARLEAGVPPEPAAKEADRVRRDAVRATIIEDAAATLGWNPLTGPGDEVLKKWQEEHQKLLRLVGIREPYGPAHEQNLARNQRSQAVERLGYDPLSQFREHRQPRVGDVLRLQNGQRIRVTNVEGRNVTFVPEEIHHPHAPHVTADISQLEQLQGRFSSIAAREGPPQIAPSIPESYDLGGKMKRDKRKEALAAYVLKGEPSPTPEKMAPEQLRMKTGPLVRKPKQEASPPPEPEPAATPLIETIDRPYNYYGGRAQQVEKTRFVPEPGTFLYQHSGPSRGFHGGKGRYYVVAPYREWDAFIKGEGRFGGHPTEPAFPSATHVALYEIDPETMKPKLDMNGEPRKRSVPLVGRKGHSAWGYYQGTVGITTHFTTIVGKDYLKKVLKRRGHTVEGEQPEEGGPEQSRLFRAPAIGEEVAPPAPEEPYYHPGLPPGWRAEMVVRNNEMAYINVLDENREVVLKLPVEGEQLQKALFFRSSQMSGMGSPADRLRKLHSMKEIDSDEFADRYSIGSLDRIPLSSQAEIDAIKDTEHQSAWDLNENQKNAIRQAYGAREGIRGGRFTGIEPAGPEKPAKPWEEELASIEEEPSGRIGRLNQEQLANQVQLKIITPTQARTRTLKPRVNDYSVEDLSGLVRALGLHTILPEYTMDHIVRKLQSAAGPELLQEVVDLSNGILPDRFRAEYERQLNYDRNNLQSARVYDPENDHPYNFFQVKPEERTGLKGSELDWLVRRLKEGKVNFFLRAPLESASGISKQQIAARFGGPGELDKLLGSPKGMSATILTYADRDWGNPVLAVRNSDGFIVAEVELSSATDKRLLAEAMASGGALPPEMMESLKLRLANSARDIAQRTNGKGLERSKIFYDYGHGEPLELKSKNDMTKVLKRWSKSVETETVRPAPPRRRSEQTRVTLTPGEKSTYTDPYADPNRRDVSPTEQMIFPVNTYFRQTSGNVYRVIGHGDGRVHFVVGAYFGAGDPDGARRSVSSSRLRQLPPDADDREELASGRYSVVSGTDIDGYHPIIIPGAKAPEETKPAAPSRPGRNPFTQSQQEAEARRRRRELYRK